MSAARDARRVLVLLDASPESLAALETGAEVAAALDARLAGLFVEEAGILALAGHPLAREVDVFAGVLRPVERVVLERRLRIQARRARARLERVAAVRSLAWSFEVTRGEVVEQVVRAASATDLVTLGRIGWSGGARRLGRTARALVAGDHGAVLLHGRRRAVGAPVVACHAGSPAAGPALDAAVALARRSGRPLRVLLFAPETEAGEAGAREVEAHLVEARGVQVGVERHRPEEAQRLPALPAVRDCGLLVLPADGPVARGDLPEALATLDCPVLLVR